MRKAIKIAYGCAAALVASLLLGQIHPYGDVNLHTVGELVLPPTVPSSVQDVLKTKCADCHSSSTHFPAYAKLAPASWLIERDIALGRKHLNLSEWEHDTAEQRETLKAKMVAEVRSGAMPPFQYRLLHGTAAIVDADVEALAAWSRETAVPVEAATTDEGDAAKGKVIFEKRCTGCHTLDADREGPRLRGVVGRSAASVAGYDYSPALKKSHLVWNEATLEQWLADPDTLVPGNNMEFRVAKAEERKDLVRYLKQAAGK